MATDKREIVSAYAQRRLAADVAKRGVRARVAERTKLSAAYISQLANPATSATPRDRALHLLAEKWWAISYVELERLAMIDAGLEPETPARARTLSAHPRWSQLVEEARRLDPSVDEAGFIAAGQSGLGPDGCPENLDVLAVLNLARDLARIAATPAAPPKPKQPPPPAAPPPQPPPRVPSRSGVQRSEHSDTLTLAVSIFCQ